jgi:hypothetical protein
MQPLRKDVKREMDFICARMYDGRMSIKEDGDPAASSLARKRWDKAKPKERAEHARKMNEARWAGHVAKRPAAGRKKAAKKKP